MGQEELIKQVAGSVRKNSYDWVLVLGNDIAYEEMKSAKAKLEEQIKEYNITNQDNERMSLCQAVQEKDDSRIRDLIFGNIWNSVSILDMERKKQQERREDYAKKLETRETINLDKYKNSGLRILLKMFQGMILTVCQDEIIEAFMEDETCMAVEDVIWTPDMLTTTGYWENQLEESRMLVKLYGTCRKPSLMLLSKDDRNMYYPEKCQNGTEDSVATVRLLKQLLRDKNLLFIGNDLSGFFDSCDKPFLAEGILRLLEEVKPENGKLRYILSEDEGYAGKWKEYGVLPIIGPVSELTNAWKNILTDQDGKNEESPDIPDIVEETGGIDDKAAASIFWKVYNRRSEYQVSQRELHILKRHLWRVDKDDDNICFNRQGIEKLAMAANTFSDFSDLWQAMEMAGNKISKNSYQESENAAEYILKERISRRSQELLRILYFYGDGFPMGFFSFIAKDQNELMLWKKAGIQLTNSGICFQSRNRKRIYEQIKYADSLMLAAGLKPGSNEFRLRLYEKNQRLEDSYFYSVKINMIADDGDQQTQIVYQEMFDKMIDTLKDKSEGYSRLCSLLVTELPALLNIIINKLHDYKDKSRLLYYLFRECQIKPNDLDVLEKIINDRLNSLNKSADNNKLGEKLMLYQVQALIKSLQKEENEQLEALKWCEEAVKQIQNYKEGLNRDRNAMWNSTIFIQYIQVYLLISKIYGKLASIKEIEKCHCGGNSERYYECRGIQRKYLNKMIQSLAEARRIINNQYSMIENSLGFLNAEMEHQTGECYFKQSQFYYESAMYYDKFEGKQSRWKFKDYKREEKENYLEAEKHYKTALAQYQKYPGQYRLQIASVLRNMADLYCRMAGYGHTEMIKRSGEYKEKCYQCLEEAYIYYRQYNNLHGIADILQSMGETEHIGKGQENRRSSRCFYHAADNLYNDLGDDWSRYVVLGFLKDA